MMSPEFYLCQMKTWRRPIMLTHMIGRPLDEQLRLQSLLGLEDNVAVSIDTELSEQKMAM